MKGDSGSKQHIAVHLNSEQNRYKPLLSMWKARKQWEEWEEMRQEKRSDDGKGIEHRTSYYDENDVRCYRVGFGARRDNMPLSR